MNEYLMIGEVLKPQGVRGEVKIKPYAADLEAFPHGADTLNFRSSQSCNNCNYFLCDLNFSKSILFDL